MMKSKFIYTIFFFFSLEISYGQDLYCNSESCKQDIERVFVKIKKGKIIGVKKFLKNYPVDSFIEKDGIRMNILLIAVLEKNVEIVQLLIDNGANSYFEVKDGITVYELAISTKNEPIISIMANESL